jgi:GNAT superfamily N-acetyltransferase
MTLSYPLWERRSPTLRAIEPAIEVRLLGHDEAALADRLAALVNEVYGASEVGLWRDGSERISAAEIGASIRAGEIAVATVDGEIAGCIRIRDLDENTSEFGTLASDPKRRGAGVGTALIDFAERSSRDRGRRAMQLELLVAREWRHPSKVFLDAWYSRLGYRAIQTRSVEAAHPELEPLLATPCDFVVYEKRLT